MSTDEKFTITGDADRALADAADEIVGLLAQGDDSQVAAVLQRHPELAAELRQLIPAIGALADLDVTSAPAAHDAAASDLLAAKQLGDFRIVREIGRGGMGIVYEAEQLSLGRRVALKILPLAAVCDERHLARFKNEVMAAALLDHPHIVRVYSVGVERGVHYYAMQLIAGESLVEVIRALRLHRGEAPPAGDVSDFSPAAPPQSAALRDTVRNEKNATSTLGTLSRPAFYRAAARWGIQAAEAVEYAHQSGVIHRDIKPSNLLIDARGELFIADFGLARIGQETNLTMTGELLGTLRYMSPEQASGRPVDVNHRSDIYSLGATLYELVALQLPFLASDRQALLRQILEQEPKSPRQIDPLIPRDLETIILKAMAKDQADRYATAQELADDLRRFVNDETIRARTPTLAQRAAKWSRRHRRLLAATVAIAVLVAICMPIAAAVWREKLRGDKTQGELRSALRKVRESDRISRESSERDSAIASASDLHAHGAACEKIWQLDNAELDYQQAIGLVEPIVNRHPQDEQAAQACARSYLSLVKLSSFRGRSEESLELADRYCHNVVTYHMAVDEPHAAEAFHLHFENDPLSINGAFVELERIAGQLNRPDLIDAAYRREIARFATNQTEKQTAHTRVSLAILAYRFSDQLLFRKTLPTRDIIGWELALGRRQFTLDYNRDLTNAQEAERAGRSALSILSAMDCTTHPQLWDLLGASRSNLAVALERLSRYSDAEEMYLAMLRESEGVLASRLAEAAANGGRIPWQHRNGVRIHHDWMGAFYVRAGNLERAEMHYRNCLAVTNAMGADVRLESTPDPNRLSWIGLRALNASYALARVLELQGNDSAAAETYREVIATARILAVVNPGNNALRNQLAWFLVARANSDSQEFGNAVELAKRCVAQEEDAAPYHYTLGLAHLRAGEPEKAIASLDRACELRPNSSYLKVGSSFVRAMAYSIDGQTTKAQAEFKRATSLAHEQDLNELDLRLLQREAASLIDDQGS